ncbi:MAG: hypothetical protein AAF430_12825 [Myxococcota bacterium]
MNLAVVGGVRWLEVDGYADGFLQRDGDSWSRYSDFVSEFGGDEALVLVVDLPADLARLGVRLGELARLSEEIAGLAGVRRVDSLSTFPVPRTGGYGEVRLGAIVGFEDGEVSAFEPAAVRDSRVAQGFLLSSDGRSSAVRVVLDRELGADAGPIAASVAEIARSYGASVTGVPIFRAAVNARTFGELQRLLPLSAALVVVVLLYALRTIAGVAFVVVPAVLVSAATIGLMGWLSVSLSLTTVTLPTIALALGAIYGTHSLFRTFRRPLEGEVGKRPRRSALGLSILTTAVGFGSMAVVPVPAVREFALVGMLSALLAGFSALTVVPALTSLVCRNRVAEALLQYEVRVHGVLDAVANTRVASWGGATVLAAIVLGGVSGWWVETDTNIIRWFSDDSVERRDYDSIRERFFGITPVAFSVAFDGAGGALDPVALSDLESFREELLRDPRVGRVDSIAEVLRDANRVLGDQDRVPSSVAMGEQLLALVGSSGSVRDLVTPSRERTVVRVLMNVNESKEIVDLGSAGARWWNANAMSQSSIAVTGTMYEFARTQEAIRDGQVGGLGLAIFIVGGLLALRLGSLRLGGMALLPNVVPVAAVYGAMAFLGIPLDAATVMIGAVALGIAVDDTVHIADELRGLHSSPRGRISVLPILALTTCVLVAGFGAIATSDFALTRNFGWLLALGSLLCFLADWIAMPRLFRLAVGVDRRARSN